MKCNFKPYQRVFSFIVLITLMTLSNLPVLAHQDQRITLNVSNKALKNVFRSIEEQAAVVIMYDMNAIDDNEKVSLNVKDVILEDVLTKLLSSKSLQWNRKGNVVRIFREAAKSFGDPVAGPLVSVSGRVTDLQGNPLPGATVLVKGSKKGVSADANGQFSIANVEQNSMLIVKLLGYEPKEVQVSGVLNLHVQLKQAVGDLDEAVVVAYGTTTQRANTGAVTVVSGKQIESLPNRSFDKSLQGLVPGLLVTNGSGQPGAGLSNMVLRGITTGTDVGLGQTFRNPLFVLDGIPVTQDNFQLRTGVNVTSITNPLAQLNPSDIESVSVLKDAAAIALYGSKASNGVILITTKKGKAGKTVFTFRSQTDISSRLKGKTSLQNQPEYLKLLYETYKNTDPVYWTDQLITNDLRSKFPTYKSTNGDTLFYSAPDWGKALFNDHATTLSNELGMSGGSETSSFYLNIEYTKQNGAVRHTGYERKSLRFNFENRPTQFIKLGINTTLSHNEQEYANATESTSSSFSMGSVMSPLNPIRLNDGSYKLTYPYGGQSRTINPVAQAEYNIYKNAAYRGLAKIYGEINVLKYFSLTSAVGADFMLAESKEKLDPRFYASSTSAPRPQIFEQDIRRINVINTNSIRFDKNINQSHNINVVLGQESQIITQRLLSASANGDRQALSYYDQISSPGYTISSVRGQTNKQTLLSLFGQLNYNLLNKYFVTSSLRRDGASKFGDEQRWGTYWSVGSGWVVSSESFMKSSMPGISYLKIRGSLGAAGSSGAIDALTRFDRLTLVKYSGSNAMIPDISPGNPDIRWEKTFSWDAGMEMRLLKDKIGFTIDYYKKKTSGLVYPVNLSSFSGYQTVLSNIGDMENKGIEISFKATPVSKRNFKWDITVNWSTNQNKLIKANVPLAAVTGQLLGNEEGRNFNSFYLPKWNGVNQDNGKPQWLGEKGASTSNYSEAKKQFYGKPQPDGFGSLTNTFSYKGFDLSAIFYYQYGQKIYNSTLATFLDDGYFPYINQVKEAGNYWKQPGDMAPNPRRVLNNIDGGNLPSTRYLFKGDYIRLQNVSLSYLLPRRQVNQLHLSALRIYIQAYNLATLTSYKGPDPDNVTVEGGTGFAYPNQRTYSIGLNASF